MFEARDVSALPIPKHDPCYLRDRVKEIIEIKMKWASLEESSALFTSVVGEFANADSLNEFFHEAKESCVEDEGRLIDLHDDINNYVDQIYGLSGSDSRLLDERLGIPRAEAVSDDMGQGDDSFNIKGFAERLVSYLVGISFGRWDIRSAKSDRSELRTRSPFLPLPALSPGRIHPTDMEVGKTFYPIKISRDRILVSERGKESALDAKVRDIAAHIWGAKSDRFEQQILRALNESSLNEYINRSPRFFSDHLKRYSRTGRAAPIYWPLSTASGSYTLWLYYPNLTSQTLYTAVNDFVEPKLNQVELDAAALRAKGSLRSREEDKKFETLQALDLELIDLRDTLLQIAPTYRPNHDDGVQITAAPLWPLFRHKPWQKVLKDTWAKLEKGDYDWAHLALSYWPDRVREKCKTDKSLAITHDLENLYVESEQKPAKARGRREGPDA
jgi:hypothetical protein